jgi:hypothetical protein
MAIENEDETVVEDQEEGGIEVEETEEVAAQETPEQAEERRASRKERSAARRRAHEDKVRGEVAGSYEARIAEMQRQHLEQMALLQQTNGRVVEAVERIGKKPPADPIEEAQARIEEAARGMRDGDDASVQKFLRVQREENTRIAELKAEEIFDRKLKQYQAAQPQGPDPAEAGYYSDAPWLADKAMYQRVVDERNRIVQVSAAAGKPRNMRDPNVRDAVNREALIEVGNRWGLPVRGAQEPARQRPASVVGAGTRGGGSGGGGADDGSSKMTAELRALADNHPTYGQLPERTRYKTFWNKVMAPREKREERP